MEKTKKRNSGFELLRIIAMLMIVANHYRTYGQYFDSAADIGLNTFFLNVFEMFGSPACSLFALITGYFMIQYMEKITGKAKQTMVISTFQQKTFIGIKWKEVIGDLKMPLFGAAHWLRSMMGITKKRSLAP